MAYPTSTETIGFSTIFTLSARTSARPITRFLEFASNGLYQVVETTGLLAHMQ